MNDKLEKKEWWDLLKGASFFAVVLTLIVNEYSYKSMEEAEIISPVISVACEYKSMVHFSDTVVIETKISSYNGIKLAFTYRMTDKETGELRSLAKSEHCFLNNSGKQISLKRAYPEIDTKFFELVDEE